MVEDRAFLKAPFPYFGGKRAAAGLVWERFGNPENYVEPFFGSGAVLLGRPVVGNIETINDKSGFVSNFWRAVRDDPVSVAGYAHNPVFENDLHAKHAWLVAQSDDLVARLEGDPLFYDARVAGWWAWYMSCSFQADGKGSWVIRDRKLVRVPGEKGISRDRCYLTCKGHSLITKSMEDKQKWFRILSERLSRVRVLCGDWSRVLSPNALHERRGETTGIFLDPPYSADRGKLYEQESDTLWRDCLNWCLDNGGSKQLRIALCGFKEDYDVLITHGWTREKWRTNNGFGGSTVRGRKNHERDVIYFSPYCLAPRQPDLFS